MSRNSKSNQQPVDRQYKNVEATTGYDLTGTNRASLTTTKTLTTGDVQFQNYTATTTETVKLPSASNGLQFTVANRTTGTTSIKLQNNGGTTLTTLTSQQVAECLYDGTGWTVKTTSGSVN